MRYKDKAKIVASVRKQILRDFPTIDMRKSCLYSSIEVVRQLGLIGISAQIQAGSVSWRCIAPELDDGGITHFSFIWSPHELASQIAMSQGHLPEIHVWVGLMEEQEVIDINSRYMEDWFQEHFPDKKWSSPKPPDFLWCSVKEMPDCIYEPNREAMRFVYRLLETI